MHAPVYTQLEFHHYLCQDWLPPLDAPKFTRNPTDDEIDSLPISKLLARWLLAQGHEIHVEKSGSFSLRAAPAWQREPEVEIPRIAPAKSHSNTVGRAKRLQICQRDQYRCHYCNQQFAIGNLEVDHIIPRAKGGSNKDENLITACRHCNRMKSDKIIPFHPEIQTLQKETR